MTILIYGINLAATILAMLVVDGKKFGGRRTLLLTGLGSMATSLGFLGIYPLLGAGTGANAGSMSMSRVFVLVVGFAVGPGPVPWILYAELFPTRLHSKGVALCAAISWTLNLTISSISPALATVSAGIKSCHSTTNNQMCALFWAFFATAAAAWLFTFKFVEETSQVSGLPPRFQICMDMHTHMCPDMHQACATHCSKALSEMVLTHASRPRPATVVPKENTKAENRFLCETG